MKERIEEIRRQQRDGGDDHEPPVVVFRTADNLSPSEAWEIEKLVYTDAWHRLVKERDELRAEVKRLSVARFSQPEKKEE